MAEPVDAPILKGDPRAATLQTQIDEISVALQDWRRTREYSQPTEHRLAHITVQCARMVESWQQMEQRRSAGGEERRGDSGAVESRLQQSTGERIRALERAIEHEWDALREGHEEPEPERKHREQAAGLEASAVAEANLTLRGFASVESRLATLEQELQGRMAQLSRDLQSVVAELRTARPGAVPGTASAFPLESVMRIHEELREADATAVSGADALKGGPARALPPWTESATALTARMESLERAVGTAAAAQPVAARRPQYVIIGLVVALAGLALFSLWMQRRVDARLNEAAARVSAAEQQRDATTAATREEAARQVADARQAAVQAQTVGNVLAAPDRVRYWLGGVGTNSRAYAQVLISRSRGMVFSASRLRPAGPGRTYQLWLLTRGGPVSGGLVTPDAAGRVTLVTDVPLTLPGRLTGVLVTLEPAGGRSQPSADRVLIRID